MGSADIIPGVSGGTIAFITGIYTRLVDGISYVADLFNPRNWEDITDFDSHLENLRGIDWSLFVPLLFGIGVAFAVLSTVIAGLLKDFRLVTYSFFFGLILGSAVFLYQDLEKVDKYTILYSFSGILLGFLIVSINGLGASHSLSVLFFSGALAITAMILPGVSGAFILLILNQYEYVLEMINNFRMGEIAVFGIGAAIGLLSFSKLLHYLLHKYRNKTIGFLTGLMVGSLRLPAEVIWNGSWRESLMGVIMFAFIGFGSVFVVERLGR